MKATCSRHLPRKRGNHERRACCATRLGWNLLTVGFGSRRQHRRCGPEWSDGVRRDVGRGRWLRPVYWRFRHAVVADHLWDSDRRNWGYGGLPKNEQEYKERYIESLEKLNTLRQQGIAAGVYTQTTDVEGEINGLITYDRKVIKIPAAELAELHRRLFEPISKSDDK